MPWLMLQLLLQALGRLRQPSLGLAGSPSKARRVRLSLLPSKQQLQLVWPGRAARLRGSGTGTAKSVCITTGEFGHQITDLTVPMDRPAHPNPTA